MSVPDQKIEKNGFSLFRIFSMIANFFASVTASLLAAASFYVYQNFDDIRALPMRVASIEQKLNSLQSIGIDDLDAKVVEIKRMHLSLLNGFQEIHVGVLTSALAEKTLLSSDQVIVVNRDHNPLRHTTDKSKQAYNGDTILIRGNKNRINQFTQLYVKEVSVNSGDKKKGVDMFIHESTAKLIGVLPLKGGEKHHVKLLKADEMKNITKANGF